MKRLTKWIFELVCQLSGFSNDDSRLLQGAVMLQRLAAANAISAVPLMAVARELAPILNKWANRFRRFMESSSGILADSTLVKRKRCSVTPPESVALRDIQANASRHK